MSIYDWNNTAIPEDVEYIWCDSPHIIGSPNKPEDTGRWYVEIGKSCILSPGLIRNRPLFKKYTFWLEKRPQEE